MLGVREYLILFTAMSLLAFTIALSVASLTESHGRVVNAVALEKPRPAVLITVEVNGVATLSEVIVESVRIPIGVTLSNGRYVILVSGTSDVHVFRDTVSALAYFRNSFTFMGAPLPRLDEYQVTLVFGDGSRLTVVAKPLNASSRG